MTSLVRWSTLSVTYVTSVVLPSFLVLFIHCNVNCTSCCNLTLDINVSDEGRNCLELKGRKERMRVDLPRKVLVLPKIFTKNVYRITISCRSSPTFFKFFWTFCPSAPRVSPLDGVDTPSSWRNGSNPGDRRYWGEHHVWKRRFVSFLLLLLFVVACSGMFSWAFV